MANKKSKGSKPKAPGANSKPKESKPVNKRPAPLPAVLGGSQLTPQEKVDRVKPYWELQSSEQRSQLLTLSLERLHNYAVELQQREADAPPDMHQPPIRMVEVLEEGIARLKERSTWKVWSWRDKDGVTHDFYDVESFKQYYHEQLLPDNLERLLPKEEGKPVEKPAEAAFRERMVALLQKVQNPQAAPLIQRLPEEQMYRGRRQRGGVAGEIVTHGVRDTNVETITMILEAFEKEHEFLYNSLLHPITAMVCEVVPDEQRETTPVELYFEDLERMHSDTVARICEWLTEKVDTLSSKLKPEPKDEDEEEEENLGDVDLFALTNDGKDLTVNAKWLQHLSERLLGEDGVPRRVKPGEDPHNMGLVLEWVYGSIVSTAEKARDAAKRSLSRTPPTAQQAYHTLYLALQEQDSWETRAAQARDLLKEMLRSRKEAADLAAQYDIRVRPSADELGSGTEKTLPNDVVVAMLRREVLLTRAKLFALVHEKIMGEKQLRTLKLQLRQGEPEFERLKREMEENRLHHRSGLDSHGRSAADVERHRQQLADSALEEQLELQSAFRETSARLQGIYDQRHRTEMEVAKRDTEIKQLQGWRVTVESLVDKFEEHINTLRANGPAPDLEEGGRTSYASAFGSSSDDLTTDNSHRAIERSVVAQQAQMQLSKLLTHFQKDVRKQLYNDEDDKHFFGWMQAQLKGIEKRLEEGRVALQHLELHLVNVACDDPGTSIGAHLGLPLLQERLDEQALEFLAERAKQAESLLYQMEQAEEAQRKADNDKKQAAKKQKQQKSKSEREKLLAEKTAKEQAERVRKEEEAKKRQEMEEEERRLRAEQLEAARKAEEEAIEKRRQELLSDTNSYWSRRMAEQKAAEALMHDNVTSSPEEEEEETASSKAGEREDASVTTDTPSAGNRSTSVTRSVSVDDDDGFVTESRRRRGGDRSHHHPAHSGRWADGPHPNGVDGRHHGPQPNGFAKGYAEMDRGARRGPHPRDMREPVPYRSGREREGAAHGVNGAVRRPARDQQEGQQGGSRGLAQPPAAREAPAKPATEATAAKPEPAAAVQAEHPRPSFAAVAGVKDAPTRAETASPASKVPSSDLSEKEPVPDSAASDSSEPRDQLPTETDLSPTAAAAAPTASASPAPASRQPSIPEAAPAVPAPIPVPASPAPLSGHEAPMHVPPPPPPPPPPPMHSSDGVHPAMLHPPNALMLGHPQLPVPPPNGTMIPPPPPPHQPMLMATMARNHFPAPPPPQMARIPHMGAMTPQPHLGGHIQSHPIMTGSQASSPGVSPVPAPPHPAAAPHGVVPQQLLAHQGIAMAGHPVGAPGTMPMLPPIPAPAGPMGPRMPLGQQSGPHMIVAPPPPPPPQQYPAMGVPVGSGPPPPPRMPYMYPSQGYPTSNVPPQNMVAGPHVGMPAHAGQQQFHGRMPVPNHQGAPMPPKDTPREPRRELGTSPTVQQPGGPHHSPSTRGPPLAGNLHTGMPSPDGANARMPRLQPSPPPREAPAAGAATQPPASSSQSAAANGEHATAQHTTTQESQSPKDGASASSASSTAPKSTLRATAQPFVPSFIFTAPPQPPAPVATLPPELIAMQQRNQQLLAQQQLQLAKQLNPHTTYPAAMGAMDQRMGRQQPGGKKARQQTREQRERTQQQQQQAWEQRPHVLQRGADPHQAAAMQAAAALQIIHASGNATRAAPRSAAAASTWVPRDQQAAGSLPQDTAAAHHSAAAEPSSEEASTAPGGPAEGPWEQPSTATDDVAASSSRAEPGMVTADEVTSSLPAEPGTPDRPAAEELAAADSAASHSSAGSTATLESVQDDESQSPDARNEPAGTSGQHGAEPYVEVQRSDSVSSESLGEEPQSRTAVHSNGDAQPSSSQASKQQPAAPPVRVMPSWSSVAGRDGPAQAAAPVTSSSSAAPQAPASSSSPSPSSSQRTQADSWRSKVFPTLNNSPARASGQQQQQAPPRPLPRQSSDPRLNTPAEVKLRQLRTGSGNGRSRSPPEDKVASPAGPARTLRIGGVTFEGLDDSVRQLRYVRGLLNDDGQYNCFLNVTIQSLWHLRCFREGMLRLVPSDILNAGGRPSDIRVIQAVWRIFKALAMEPTDEEPVATTQDAAAAAPSSPAATNGHAAHGNYASLVRGWTVNPWQLREALSGLDGSEAAVRIQLSEMHDASEVLGEIFNCLHRAELGRALEGQVDVQLPQRVAVRRDGGQPSTSHGPPTMAQKVAAAHANGNGSAANGSSSTLATGTAKRSMVHKLFGLDVQVVCPPSSDESDDEKQGGKQSRRASRTLTTPGSSTDGPKKGPKKPRDPSLIDVEHFMKYFHLVPAQGLRQAYDALLDGSFEDVLCEAETADTLAERARTGVTTVAAPKMTLLRRPRVFTLAVVWESPQAPMDAIRNTTEALAPELDLAQVFSGLGSSCKYRLRSVVCYCGHHYQAFACSEELQQWLLLDDTTIKLVGDWRDVVRMMQRQRLQASLLFYEGME